MADKTKIEWTDATWNPITGCSIASPGCIHCYAMRLAGTRMRHHPSRAGLTVDTKAGSVWNGEVRFNEQWLLQPLEWSKPRRIFPCAHGDLFHEKVPDEWIDKIFAIMAFAGHHTFQPLTKRIDRARAYLSASSRPGIIARALLDMVIAGRLPKRPLKDGDFWPITSVGNIDMPDDIIIERWPLPNVWVGTSVENQEWADQRVPLLLDTPAAIRWVSAEPLLGPIDFRALNPGAAQSLDALAGISRSPDYDFWPKVDWIVVGGESGPRARPMHPDWARSIRDQCAAVSTAFTFKQWGEWLPWHHFHGGINDDPEQTRYKTMEWSGGRWEDVGFPLWCDTVDGNIDDDHCLGRVGKKLAGRLLDGVTHDAFPEAR